MDTIKTRAISKSFSIAIFLLTLIGTINANAQEYKPLDVFEADTIAYLQYNFIEQKDQYIGKSLEHLTNKYEMFFYFLSYETYAFAPGANGVSYVYGGGVKYRFSDESTRPNGVLVFKFAEPHPELKPLQALSPDPEDDREWVSRIGDLLIIEDIKLKIELGKKD